MSLTHVSLFSGIGGMDLAADWAGFTTIAQVERDPYCLKILNKHWPNVPKFEDICNVTSDSIREAGISQPSILSGGFPCQPFSTAGKRQGTKDDRYLWPEMLRLVQELRPAWVLGENVAGLVHMALDQVLFDLESAGYSCRAFVVPAAGVNAPHYRDRVFIVAYSDSRAESFRGISRRMGRKRIEGKVSETWYQPVSETETGICGDDDGVSNRLDRLRALGNAVVPQQVYPIFAAIAALQAEVTA